MDRAANLNGHEHVIGVSEGNDASASISECADHGGSHVRHGEDSPSTSTPAPVSQLTSLSPTASNSRNSSLLRRTGGYGRANRSPLNSGLWITVELVVNVSQIIAAAIVLSLSRHEHPRNPLFLWIIGYTIGCIATLPHLYWRYLQRNTHSSVQNPAYSNQNTSHNNHLYSSVHVDNSVTRDPHRDNGHNQSSELGQTTVTTSPRIIAIIDNFKMALDCFFAVWFVVGNVWVFGGRSSSHDAPNLYKLCIVFLAFSCIGYALPFILVAMICCCLPCIISVMGFREDTCQGRGATSESINALPSYKFKLKRQKNRADAEIDSESHRNGGGIIAAGTDKERAISAEDAVCCICLAKYVDDVELRELPCSHCFHKECVDKWLKINALCPLCKTEVGTTNQSLSTTGSGIHHRTVGWAEV